MKEKTIRYSEIFYSFQGEAEMAGKPTVWIRFFGCNLECNGFGQEHPTRF
jgi:organic radical activating enzyme